jgi:hypothetical protein
MSVDAPSSAEKTPVPILERITALVLVLVLGSLGWMIAAAYRPELASSVDMELQITAILVLLGAALVLVSVLALLRTRPRKE